MAKQVLECSFCGRKKSETNLLIAGMNAHVCDRCIEQAHGIVLEELKSTSGLKKQSKDLVLIKPNQKSHVGCGIQSLQKIDAIATRWRC
jgi:ATP-dependent Clp protease ATP-binding subunit ClpX